MEKRIKKVSVLMKQILYWAELAVGGFFTLGFVSVTVTYISEGQELGSILIGVFMSILTFLVTRNGFRGSRLISQYKKYFAILAVNGERSLERLASISHVPADKFQKQIEQMIKRGYFGSAYINYDTMSLVLADDELPQEANRIRQVQNTQRYRTVVCQACGATNKVAEGMIGECEFCGSLLEAVEKDNAE